MSKKVLSPKCRIK